MSIYVNMDSLFEASEKYQGLCTEIASVTDSFSKITSTLDWNIKSKANVQKYIQKVCDYLFDSQKILLAYSTFFNKARESYFEAEKYNEIETQKLKKNIFGANYKSGEKTTSYISDAKSKNLYDKVYSAMEKALFGSYRNVSNLKSLSCTVTLTNTGVSFGSDSYRNAAGSIASETYTKACAIISAAKSNLMQKVLQYYPTLKKGEISFAPKLVQSKTSYSSSYTAVYKLTVNIYF